MVTSAAQAQFAGGSGTEEDPYRISTLEQLQAVGDSANLDKHFIQIADIDASDTKNWNDGMGFKPIGSGTSIDNAFTGTFDGQGYVISNLSIIRSEENDVGLFGYTEFSTVIKNVHLAQIQVQGRYRVGGLVGLSHGLIIEHSGTSGQVNGNKYVGGLVGWSYSNIKKAYAHTVVTGEEYAGGLAGYGWIIIESYSTGNITGSDVIGGLVGSGLYIRNSYATGDVSGNRIVGSLVGENDSSPTGDFASIIRSYATGKVTGEELTGGLIGSNVANIIGSYWSSQASGRDIWIGSSIKGLLPYLKTQAPSEEAALEAGTGSDLEGSVENIEANLLDQVENGHNSKSYPADMFWPPTIDLEDLTTAQMTGQNAWIFMHKLDFEHTWQLTEGYPVLRWQEPEDSVEVPEAAIITVSERELDFGIVATGDTAIHKFRIVNKGNVNMQAEIMLPVPTEDHSIIFSIIAGEGTYQLEPGSTHSVEVVFLPKFVREYAELILLMHDAQNENEVIEIRLMGSGKEGTSAEEEKAHQPDRVQLLQNYPNPFNPSTRIRYSLPESAHVTVEVFDIAGRHVATLVDRLMPAGEHATNFDAGGLSSGIYVYRMSASGQTLTRRMTLIR